jgi:hypothetical protein
MPPQGIAFSLTAEPHVERTGDHGLEVRVAGGPVLAEYMGDLVLSIVVPDVRARQYRTREEEPMGWQFSYYWLPPDVADRYRDSLEVWVPETGEQIPPDLLRKDHHPVVTERVDFGTWLPLTQRPTKPTRALCVCGDRWDWGHEDDLDTAFATWLSRHSAS